ncbi:autophagy-related protein 16-1-like [Eublepharis macularius]|uniref:Autophagy-related protein 16-1-like n=1 Tax=Eublepharis macularius TaxID=481883 RepID=A0AA97K4E7_EUBMA|nr:autophagy-related protein 16-1-like [Eublepharis macularius]
MCGPRRLPSLRPASSACATRLALALVRLIPQRLRREGRTHVTRSGGGRKTGMQRAAWRQHVQQALERLPGTGGRLNGRRGRASTSPDAPDRRLCSAPPRPDETLQDRLETLLGGAGAGAEHLLAAVELRREREELRQQLAVATQSLERAEAETREQRARAQRLARDLGALRHQHQELQGRAWALSREAEELRAELHRARQERLELEARWVREKAREAQRLNCANEQREKYQRKVSRLLEKLERARGAPVLIPRTGLRMAVSDANRSASWEEAETAAAIGQVEAVPPSTSSPVGWDRTHPSSTGAEVWNSLAGAADS